MNKAAGFIASGIGGLVLAGGIAVAATGGSQAGSGNYLPLPRGEHQSEKVSVITYGICQSAIAGTRAQFLAAPKDQQAEILAVEKWCDAFAIRTNPTPLPSHKG